MRTVDQFPRPVRAIENLWIPMHDGARLAARVWLPDDAGDTPVPVILEAIPYRKRDFTRGRDEPIHRYLAGHGYAAVRIDLRGSGDSDGILSDEYTLREHDDLVSAIEWLAGRPWSTGAVGMTGISWGGFNALQVAARRPRALRAILTLCSSDDRYADDAHYMGGCVLGENLTWGSVLMAVAALPPDPEVVGEGWREAWRARLEALSLFPAAWLRHPRRDAYWRHGSVCEDYAAIDCPVYAVGGWADGYSNAVLRLLAHLDVPRKGLVGPWSHAFPHDAEPGPAIGFLQEGLRWWDHWLKGIDTGIMDEPMLRVWMQESVRPAPSRPAWPGRWVAEWAWPSPEIRLRSYRIVKRELQPMDEAPDRPSPDDSADTDGEATATSGPVQILRVRSPQTVGLGGGEWCAFGSDGELPADQREDDAGSLVFDTALLAEDLEILGAPIVELTVAADRPVAVVAARVSDVWPDGAGLRVSYGLLNLTHRDGHSDPILLSPGERVRVRIQLNDAAHAFPAGHRIRLALSTSYWPIAWPAPEAATLEVVAGQCRLRLPVRSPRSTDDALAPFAEPEAAPGPDRPVVRPAPLRRSIVRDLVTGETVYALTTDADHAGSALRRIEAIDLEVGHTLSKRFAIGRRDPLSARGDVEQRLRLKRGEWDVGLDVTTRMTASTAAFRVSGTVIAREGGETVHERRWDEEVPRDHV